MQDIRYALRGLLKNKSFTIAALLTLSLGIGANTAIFTIYRQVLMKSLPVHKPEELVILRSPGPKNGRVIGDTDKSAQAFSYPMYKDLRDRPDSKEVFSGLIARFYLQVGISYAGQSSQVWGEIVSGNYFNVLGVQPALGRVFTAQDDISKGGHPVAVLSYQFWQDRFGGDPRILNQIMKINGHHMTIVGVTQKEFRGVQKGFTPNVFLPMTMKGQMTPNNDGLDDRMNYWAHLIGRVKPGITMAQAEARLAPVYKSILESEAPLQRGMRGNTLKRFTERQLNLIDGSQGRLITQEEVSAPLKLLMGIVGFILLITCANVAGLLIARSAERQKEIAVRQALGASRWRMIRQLLMESIVLSVIGGIAGFTISLWLSSIIGRLMFTHDLTDGVTLTPDSHILLFNFGVSFFTGIVFGVLPAFKAVGSNTMTELREKGSGKAAKSKLRKTLVACETALAIMLLVGAALFARSLYNLKQTNLGLKTDRIITFSLSPELIGYDGPRAINLFQRLEQSLSRTPGIQSVSTATIPIMADNARSANVILDIKMKEVSPETGFYNTGLNDVGPGYFTSMGISLIRGREFNDKDTSPDRKVAVVNESFARKFFENQNPIGHKLMFGGSNRPQPHIEIVGIVKDSKHITIREQVGPFVYTPYMQNQTNGSIYFYLRTSMDQMAIASILKSEVAKLESNLPIAEWRTLDEQINRTHGMDRFTAFLSCAFALLAALLAAIGIYGVIAYSVSQRTHEIGLRMALGAMRSDILKMMTIEGIIPISIGAAVGLIASFMLVKYTESMLYGVSAKDPIAFVVAAALLLVAAFLACIIPARRASKVDPMIALRYE